MDGDAEFFDNVGYGLYDCCCGAFMYGLTLRSSESAPISSENENHSW